MIVSDPAKRSQILREVESLRSLSRRTLSLEKPAGHKEEEEEEDSARRHMMSAPCRNIIELYDVLQNPLDGTLSLCLEHMDEGSLQLLVQTGGCADETILSSIAYQILQGLRHLHQLRMVHRDIKPSNLLVSRAGLVKLSDFGLARTLDLGQSLADSFLGTFEYMAPERLAGDSYSFSADIWSFGLALHAIAIGGFPFSRQRGFWQLLHATQDQASRPLPPRSLFSVGFIDFIAAACEKEASKRPLAAQLLAWDFVAARLEIIPPALWRAFKASRETSGTVIDTELEPAAATTAAASGDTLHSGSDGKIDRSTAVAKNASEQSVTTMKGSHARRKQSVEPIAVAIAKHTSSSNSSDKSHGQDSRRGRVSGSVSARGSSQTNAAVLANKEKIAVKSARDKYTPSSNAAIAVGRKAPVKAAARKPVKNTSKNKDNSVSSIIIPSEVMSRTNTVSSSALTSRNGEELMLQHTQSTIFFPERRLTEEEVFQVTCDWKQLVLLFYEHQYRLRVRGDNSRSSGIHHSINEKALYITTDMVS